jgi:hypothetical protein
MGVFEPSIPSDCDTFCRQMFISANHRVSRDDTKPLIFTTIFTVMSITNSSCLHIMRSTGMLGEC